MTNQKTAAVILAAGLGTRMKSNRPKCAHPIGGRPMLTHLLETVDALGAEPAVTVIGPGMEDLARIAGGRPVAVQERRLGTGHAVQSALEALENAGGLDGDVLVLYGDTPLITRGTLERMLAARRGADDPAVVVLGFRPLDAAQYGRLVLHAEGHLERIVEFKDASAEERTVELCNSGVMCIDGGALPALLERLDNDNAKGEYYLTDAVAHARAMGRTCVVGEGAEEELLGINSRLELAAAERVLQDRLRRRAMDNGATLVAPETVFFHSDTELGRDVVVEPSVVFGPGVTVADGALIRAFSHLEGVNVGPGAQVGPYARLRPGTTVGAEARIGNFVEVKQATVEEGAKVNHLSYIGDARVGEGANVGAGTITCNYDGFGKHRTDIGRGAFIGSNTSLVAPVRVGDGALVGAGSTIARDVPDYALILGNPGKQKGWMSRHGHVLKNKDNDCNYVCPESGYRYRLSVNGDRETLKCLDLDEEESLPDDLSSGSKSYDEFKLS